VREAGRAARIPALPPRSARPLRRRDRRGPLARVLAHLISPVTLGGAPLGDRVGPRAGFGGVRRGGGAAGPGHAGGGGEDAPRRAARAPDPASAAGDFARAGPLARARRLRRDQSWSAQARPSLAAGALRRVRQRALAAARPALGHLLGTRRRGTGARG